MDTVIFDGVEYEKASVLAKRFRYTSDYIGQLCRTKKVDARLVGRSWFVNEASVKEYRLKKKQKSQSKKVSKKSGIAIKTKLSRKTRVLPVLQNRTVKSVTNLAVKIDGVSTKKLSVSYEPDDEKLIPKLIKKKVKPAKTIRIEQVNPKKISIKKAKRKATDFTPSELPEVALSGKVQVLAVNEPVESESVEKINKDTNHQEVLKNRLKLEKDSLSENSIQKKVQATPESEPKNKLVPKDHPAKADSTDAAKVAPQPAEQNFKEDLVDSPDKPLVIGRTPELKAQKVPFLVRVSPLIATILAVLCVLLILSTSENIFIADSVYDSNLIIKLSNLREIISQY